MQHTDPSRFLILRLKLFDCHLKRNVAKFGTMNPFIEIFWNDEKWKTQVRSGGHQNPSWNEGHIFESPEAAPLTIKVFHSTLLFTQQEIAAGFISTEELTAGKTKEWIDLFFEGKPAGKLQISVCMYEERRSEQSTHTTSYAALNLKEEYHRKLNELELEKEELEFYKRKYKRKLEKLNQEKRNYQHKVKEIVKKATPKHTEESSSDEPLNISSQIKIFPTDDPDVKLRSALQREPYWQRDNLVSDQAKLRRDQQRSSAQRKVVTHSQGKLSEIAKSMDMAHVPDMKKSASGDKVSRGISKFTADWCEVEEIKKKLLKEDDCDEEEKEEELLELKLDMSKPFTSPRRAVTPKSTDLRRTNEKFKGNHFPTGKFVLFD